MLRNISFILSISFLSLASVNVSAAPRTVTLDVPGMTCQFCPITVRKALNKVDGVIDAKSDYESKTATVTYDDTKTTEEVLTETTASAGYPSSVKK